MESKPARIRSLVVISRKTGETIAHTVELLPNASFEERMAGLKAVVPSDLGPGRRVCRVICDNCGFIAVVNYDNPRLPAGWTARDSEEFCPDCSRSPSESTGR
jgi:hypothetical protein